MASSSSKDQLATVQMHALNTVCLQFADADKKALKREVMCLKRKLGDFHETASNKARGVKKFSLAK